MKHHETTAKSQQRGKQNSAIPDGGVMETRSSNDNNLSASQRSFTKHRQPEIRVQSAEKPSKWCKFTWRVNENTQGKDVRAASETNVFAGTWLLLLEIPFSADHTMDTKKNTF